MANNRLVSSALSSSSSSSSAVVLQTTKIFQKRDIVLCLLMLLNPKELCQMALVCHLWNDVANDQRVWRHHKARNIARLGPITMMNPYKLEFQLQATTLQKIKFELLQEYLEYLYNRDAQIERRMYEQGEGNYNRIGAHDRRNSQYAQLCAAFSMPGYNFLRAVVEKYIDFSHIDALHLWALSSKRSFSDFVRRAFNSEVFLTLLRDPRSRPALLNKLGLCISLSESHLTQLANHYELAQHLFTHDEHFKVFVKINERNLASPAFKIDIFLNLLRDSLLQPDLLNKLKKCTSLSVPHFSTLFSNYELAAHLLAHEEHFKFFASRNERVVVQFQDTSSIEISPLEHLLNLTSSKPTSASYRR